ncbi:MAG: hypothetical protein KTR29_05965 [Rhodothermaceae bacterium]|nr:hypothetical protein [Rhodothermaceae bacterium]
MRYIHLSIFAILFIVSSCSSPDQSPSTDTELNSELIGMWVMGSVYQDTLDVTDEHNPALNRWIAFSEEGTFESGGAPYGYNSGKWGYTSESNELFLDSDAGEGDDSYWIIINSDTSMEWQGTRSDFTSQFKLKFKKKGF